LKDGSRILLVRPAPGAEPYFPLGLASVAAVLLERRHAVWGADLQFDTTETVVRLAQEHLCQWVGFSVLHHTVEQVGRVVKRLKQATAARTFAIGSMPCLDPEKTLLSAGVDYAIQGDPELAVAELLESDGGDRLPAGCASLEGGIFRPPQKRAVVELEGLPFADRSLFSRAQYSFGMRTTAQPAAAIFTSRGCDRSCPFCPVPSIRPAGFDARSVDGVYDEMERLVTNDRIACLLIEDDLFTADRSRVEELCERLIAKPLPVFWELVNGVRPDSVDEDLLQHMAGAGCSRIVFGFEHLSRAMQSEVCSHPEKARRAVEAARGCGLRVGGYFIVGIPGVDIAGALHGGLAAIRLGLDDANFMPYYDCPDTTWGLGARTPVIRRPWTVELAKVLQMAFLGKPRPMVRLVSDLLTESRGLPNLASKARELMQYGGPVPLRDNP